MSIIASKDEVWELVWKKANKIKICLNPTKVELKIEILLDIDKIKKAPNREH